jgi:hypothetical protein
MTKKIAVDAPNSAVGKLIELNFWRIITLTLPLG